MALLSPSPDRQPPPPPTSPPTSTTLVPSFTAHGRRPSSSRRPPPLPHPPPPQTLTPPLQPTSHKVRMERESHEEADERREAVIASAASLCPNFKLKSGINVSQLSKFQELHMRRLQIKAKSKIHKIDKGANGKGKSHKMAFDIQESADQEPSKPTVDSTGALKSENGVGNISSQEDNVTRNAAAKIRQKLFWGLDTKERWERKSNM